MTMIAGQAPLGPDDSSTRRWLFAIAVVAAAHAGILYWLIATRTIFAPEGEPPAAVLMDLAPMPEEPPAENPADVPPEVVEPEPEPEPEVEPEEAVVIPEPPIAKRPVAILMPRTKPTPKKKVAKATPKKVERRAGPSRATAGAPSQGSSASSGASNASWHAQVAAHIRRHKPGGAQERGTCVVSFAVDRGGRVMGAHVSRSSGSAALDRAALSMIHNSNPVPAPPSDVSGSRFPFSVPVNFR
jgi:protein TonB